MTADDEASRDARRSREAAALNGSGHGRRQRAAPSRAGRVLTLAAILLLAINLRIVVASLGVLLPQVRTALGMSGTVAGVLTTIPVLCFAAFGVITPALSSRWGLDRTAAVSLALLAVALIARPFLDGEAAFVLLTVVGCGGAALGNVLLPALTHEHFPDRVPLVSSLFGAALVGGNTLASATTVPLAEALGGWQPALAAWALAAVMALLPWLVLGAGSRVTAPDQPRFPLRTLVRSPLAWAMTVVFATQSATAYAQLGWFPTILRDGGLDATQAALMLAVITGVGIPLTLLLPPLMRLTGHRPWLPIGYAVLTVAGWVGVLLAPAVVPWLWAVLLGIGSTTFTWVLALIGQKSLTVAGTAALSAFVQSFGYLAASIGPFGAGLLHDLTGSWTPPLLGLIGIAVVMGAFGVVINRPGVIEDDLG